MDPELIAVAGIVAMALLFDFTNGFHDAANSVSTVVATRVLRPRHAVWFAAAFNFLAYFFVGTAVANTVAKTVDSGVSGLAVIFSALLGAIVWNYATWWIGMPSSSSHALIGGLVGAGLSAGGTDAVNWTSVERTALAIVVSPLVAFTVAVVAVYCIGGLQRVTGWADNARPFKGLQLVSAAAVSFGHGANDAQKTMGVVAALLVTTGHLAPAADGTVPVPEWVALSAYAAIAAGTMWGGWKIIETMGLKITTLHASTGAAANVGASTAIFGATALGIPISTTHAAASSVTGAGVASRAPTNWRVIREMLTAWVVTMPATAAVAWGVHRLTQLPTVLAAVLLSVLLVVLGWLAVYAMRHSLRADDVEAEVPPEEVLAVHGASPSAVAVGRAQDRDHR